MTLQTRLGLSGVTFSVVLLGAVTVAIDPSQAGTPERTETMSQSNENVAVFVRTEGTSRFGKVKPRRSPSFRAWHLETVN